MTEPHLWARPLAPEFAEPFLKLMDRSECGGCYCMYWHFTGDDVAWTGSTGPEQRAAKLKRIAESGDTGMILFEDQEPVGWCQFGPRKSFPKLEEKKQLPAASDGLWCINCFMILPEKRRQGYARALLAISLEHLKNVGAKLVEAYPKPGNHEDGEVWTGPEKLFLDAGFSTATDASAPPVLRKRL